MATVECFVDPTCPWCRVVTTWLRQLRAAGVLDVRWRFLSLALLDEAAGEHRHDPVAAIHARGAAYLALLAAVRRLADEEAVDRTLAAVSAAVLDDLPPGEVDAARLGAWAARAIDPADLLRAADVDPAIAGAISDQDRAAVEQDTWTAVDRVGRGLGAPVITLDPPDGPSFFGPVLSAPPADAAGAVRLWQALSTLAGQPGFAELRTARRKEPDWPLLRALAREHRTAPRNAIVAAIDDPARRPVWEVALRARFGADYRIVVGSDRSAVMGQLGDVDRVAVALAPIGTGAFDLLATVRDQHPDARLVAIVDVGDRSVAEELHTSLTLGLVDHYVGQPWATPEEELYPVIGEALRTWVADRGVQYDKAVIVDGPEDHEGRGMVNLLQRNGIAARLLTTTSDEGRRLREGPLADLELPAIQLWDGRVLGHPDRTELAEVLGGNTRPRRTHYDLAIVGAGPAGLAAAVYAGSEGLQAAMIEAEAIGGQAGTSTQIRNYPGFPWTVRGADLASRASRQAEQFGVEQIVTRRAVAVEVDGDERVIRLSNDDVVRASSVVLACGVSYRRLGVPAVDDLIGKGVFYGAGASEAAAMGGRKVFVLGGGNSAGQSAAHLAASGAEVEVLLRGDSLAAKMSDYLVRKLQGMRGVTVRHNVEVTGATGGSQLTGLHLTDRRSGATTEHPCDALFIFIGTRPHTDWLRDALVLDDRGFVVTGSDGAAWLETSVPGVFAAGDVRAGSVKRVAAAVGEGSSAAMLALARARA